MCQNQNSQGETKQQVKYTNSNHLKIIESGILNWRIDKT